jgi:hypothetical protein
VDVNWTGGNTGDVQRGHWSFGLAALPRGFYPNASTATVDLWGVTTEELDADPNFINAVRVRARRQSPPITSFFARIFGFQSFQGSAEAVAYIGFAGTLGPADVDSPIAMCKQALLEKDISGEDKYDCTQGRFINDAAGGEDEETGMWTSFEQHLDPVTQQPTGDPCSGGTNASEVKPLVDCNAGGGVNPAMLYLGRNMEVNNGQISTAFNEFYQCWQNPPAPAAPADYEESFMAMALPVIDCINDPTTCAPLVGSVTVYVAWITQQPNLKDLPVRKEAFYENGLLIHDQWVASAATHPISGINCSDAANPDQCVWDSFAAHYDLRDAEGNLAAYQAKTIYFLKSCEDHIPQGVTGGENFGILAKIPVLVD